MKPKRKQPAAATTKINKTMVRHKLNKVTLDAAAVVIDAQVEADLAVALRDKVVVTGWLCLRIASCSGMTPIRAASLKKKNGKTLGLTQVLQTRTKTIKSQKKNYPVGCSRALVAVNNNNRNSSRIHTAKVAKSMARRKVAPVQPARVAACVS